MIPQLPLLFIGTLALLATLGLFYNFRDRWTGVLVGLTASVLWGTFGLSSYDVIVTSSVSPPQTEAILPLVYLGIALAIVTFLFTAYDMISGAADEVRETDIESVMGR